MREALPPWVAGAMSLGVAERTALGIVLVVAPHADDESLGCGGLVALLADAGQVVWIVAVSDGCASHPGSIAFDARARRELREAELVAAAACLGVPPARVMHMGLPDGAVPAADEPGFTAGAGALCTLVRATRATTLLVPWRRDSHRDHRATWALARAAADGSGPLRPRLLEYLVWAGERGEPGDLPGRGEAAVWRVDVRSVQDRKRRAIAAHRSQAGLVITDDPTGFTLPAAMRERAAGPTEYFLQVRERMA
ncbi:MAG: PIG-L deacetylase family protein [Caldimonas sp.]